MAATQNEASFIHAADHLAYAIRVEWEVRLHKLADAFGVSQPMIARVTYELLPKE